MALIKINEETDFFKRYKNYKEAQYSFLVSVLRTKKSKEYDWLNSTLLQTIEQSTTYINSQFKSSGNPPIDLYILPVIDEDGAPKNKIQDEGAVFYAPNPEEYIVDPHILISQNYSLGLDKRKVVAQNMIDSLGQEDFAKIIFYHETGHYLDYLLSCGLLRDVSQNKDLLSTNFLDRADPLYQNFLNSWQSTLMSEKKYDENHIDYFFRQMMKENAADCWACICLFQEKVQNSLIDINNTQKIDKMFKAIISATIQARKLSHSNNPESEYATYNALVQLYSNYKIYKPHNNQDWVNIVQKSIQEGLILNLEEIVDTKYNNHKKLANKIIEYKDKNSTGLDFQKQRQNMIDRLKSHKIKRRDPDKFTQNI